jgi:hypothetical protein
MSDRRTKAAALEYVQKHLDLHSGQTERRALEASWFVSCAYYAGQQNLSVDQYGEIHVPPDELNYRANLIKPQMDRSVAKVLSAQLDYEAAPTTSDRDDLAGARVATKVFEHLRHVADWTEAEGLALKWAALNGTGFVKVTWDPDGGESHRAYERDGIPVSSGQLDKKPELRQQLDKAGDYEEFKEGEVSLEALSGFHIYVDPTHRKPGLKGCRWVAQVQYMSVESVRNTWNIPRKDITPTKDMRPIENYIGQFQNMIPDGNYFTNTTTSQGTGEDMVRVVEFWERPTRENGMRGRRIVIAGDHVIRHGPNPYLKFGIELPFTAYYWTKMPGRFWGLGLVEQLRPIQRAYNRARSNMLTFQEKHSWPVTWVPKGSGVALAKLASYPGAIYTYKAAIGKPTTTEAPQMPAHVAQNAAVAQGEMQSVSAQAPPESSNLPGSLRSGQAIALMQQDNNMLFSEILLNKAASDANVGSQMLRIVGVMYDDPRTIRVVGRNRSFDVQQFTGADMRGNYDIRIIGKPRTADSREAVKSEVMELLQIGAMNAQDPDDRRRILRAFEYNDADALVDTHQRAIERQQNQIERIVSEPENPNSVPQALEWEDHATMASVLEAFMHGQEFEALPDGPKAAIVMLWKARSQKVAEAMQAQMQMAAMTAGTPGEKGNPSQPRRTG